jgi:hypothetical protein
MCFEVCQDRAVDIVSAGQLSATSPPPPPGVH